TSLDTPLGLGRSASNGTNVQTNPDVRPLGHQCSSTPSSTFVHSVTTARPSMASPPVINVPSLRHQRSAIHRLNHSAIRFNSVRPTTSLTIDVRFQAFGISFA
ncbi:hypothetical protein VIGAN_03117700, partial [Vigna angularis var. angularis]